MNMQINLQNINTPMLGFDEIREIDENGNEFWRARNLFEVFGYSAWEKFEKVINRGMKACVESDQRTEDHFHQLVKMVCIGSNTVRKVKDYKLGSLVGKVRQTIKDIGGVLPENLKTEKHIKEIKKSVRILKNK
jgi:hypothetical protein